MRVFNEECQLHDCLSELQAFLLALVVDNLQAGVRHALLISLY